MVKQLRIMLHRCKSQRGVALLATMMAIALMTIIVMDFTSSSALGYLSAANHANEIRSAYLARSAINVGLALLAQDTRAQQMMAAKAGSNGATAQSQPFDSLASVWAIPFPPMPVNGGTIQLSVIDEARKFNINSLITALPQNGTTAPTSGTNPPTNGTTLPPNRANQAANGTTATPNGVPPTVAGQIDPKAVDRLTRLMTILGLRTEIVPAIVDWLDRDSIESPNGAEADFYLKLIPPYEPRNGPMPTLGDLRLIRGIDDATFAKLRNYLTVAPENLVNPNTASPEILACLEPELMANPDIVKGIIQARSIRPFSMMTDLTNLPGVSSVQKLTSDLTLRGQYFTITGVGNYAGARKLVFAAFRRNPDGTAYLGSWQED